MVYFENLNLGLIFLSLAVMIVKYEAIFNVDFGV